MAGTKAGAAKTKLKTIEKYGDDLIEALEYENFMRGEYVKK